MDYIKDGLKYTHLIVETKNKANTELWSSLQENFDTLDFVDCFNSIGIQYNSIMPIKIKTKPCLAILKRKPGKGVAPNHGELKEIKKRKKKSVDDVQKSEKDEMYKKKSKKSIEETAEEFIEPKVDVNERKEEIKKSQEVGEEEEEKLSVRTKERRKRKKSEDLTYSGDHTTLQMEENEVEDEENQEKLEWQQNDQPMEEIIKIKKIKKLTKHKFASYKEEDPVSSESLPEENVPVLNEVEDPQELSESSHRIRNEEDPSSGSHVPAAENKDPDLSTLLGSAVSLEDDAIVSTVESYEDLPNSEELTDNTPVHKEINFQELRNLALGQVNRKTKATKLKIRRLIEQHYRSKGKHIENDSIEKVEPKPDKSSSTKQSVKAIIKQERIKDMIEQISTMDLTKLCNLDKVSTKDCLKSVIDKIDDEDKIHKHS